MEKINLWNWVDYDEIGSTNDVAKKAESKLLVTAKKQTGGRGRRGRSWESLDGNLFLSISLEVDLRYLGQMVFVAALSLAETIKKLSPSAQVEVKWPNDVLLNAYKVSGILLEKGEKDFLIIGIGVNIEASPKIEGLIYPAISLKEASIKTDRITFLKQYMNIFDANLKENFSKIKEKWLNLAKGLNQEIIVKDESIDKKGIFSGIDENGMLLLKKDGKTEKIYAGDVFFSSKE